MKNFLPVFIKVRIIDGPPQSTELGGKANARSASINTAQPMADAMMTDEVTMMIRSAIAEFVEQLVVEPDADTPDMTTEFDSGSTLEKNLDAPEDLHQGRKRRLH
jgi:hypothetical protein